MKNVWKKRGLSFLLAVSLVATSGIVSAVNPEVAIAAESKTITSMDYYPGNGPDYSASTMDAASFGFIMPVFNGDTAQFGDVAADLGLDVQVNGQWVDIDSYDGLVYNSNWGHWNDAGFTGLWFKLTQSLNIRLYAKSNPSIRLDYHLTVNKANMNEITGIQVIGNTSVSANRSGTGFINWPKAVTPSGAYQTDAGTFAIYVKPLGAPASSYVDIGNNAESGWIYDENFGFDQYGTWFRVEEMGSINVKYVLKGNNAISQEYEITYSDTKRDDYTVHANGGTVITADPTTGACGIVLPWLGGTGDAYLPTSKELGKFVYKYYEEWNNTWVDFTDPTLSNWYYSGNGYSDFTSKNQWGYFDDYVYGLWFQPVTKDMKLRVYFPMNGELGGDIGDNYVEFDFVGAPNAYRPTDVVVDDITVDNVGNNANLSGWTLYESDEFTGNALDMSKWNYNTGFLIDPSEPGTAGWGNNELEHYTDSTNNIFVKDGNLHLVAKKEPKTFVCTDSNRTQVTAEYSSGKITSKDKISFTYGRIDFRAKLPTGEGVWPALWMLPNDDTYGTWAASGEIDVMEARGRIDNQTLGTLHFGGKWPENRNVGGTYTFPEGTNYADDYHVYSCIWVEDNITFYVDGHFYAYIPKERWYSTSSDKATAPFDVDFYVIMNLAIGGNFDGGRRPGSDFTEKEMLVDYVRIYKEAGSVDVTNIPVKGLELTSTASELMVGQTAELTKVFAPANTTEKNVTWTSSNNAVATVSAGQVTAVGEGTAVITATSTANPNVKASYTITVKKTQSSDQNNNNENNNSGSTTPVVENFIPSKDAGVHRNNDGTITLYVKAKNTAFAPMVFYGANLTNPALHMMGGHVLTRNEKFGADYFSYTSAETYSENDVISYLLSYTPLDRDGRMDSAIETIRLGDIVDAPASKPVESPVEIPSQNPVETPTESKPVETRQPKVLVSNETFEAIWNVDGTVTFNILANENEWNPLVFWGMNVDDPQLWKLAGHGMDRDYSKAGLYSFTTGHTVEAGSTLSFMFGYTPYGESGRRDSAMTTVTVK